MTYQEKLQLFSDLCYENKNTQEIMDIMKITRKTLNNYEKCLGIKCAKNIRMPKLDVNFFENIDNEYKAYILGFIAADGYIESNERTLTFNINKKDIDILYKIKDAVSCENDIKNSSTKDCVRLYLSSIKLVNDLKKISYLQK